jgi:hypothetical protein
VEVIVVDNGSNKPLVLDDQFPHVTFLAVDNPNCSPVPAVNLGLRHARADFIGVMIDGARMASPGLLSNALRAQRLSPRAVVTSLAFHLGDRVQSKSVPAGYCAEVEDALLASIPWRENGYALFTVSVFAASSSEGWFAPPAESNALFMSRSMWDELEGFDERFVSPGGGLANHDVYVRATSLPDACLVCMLGEATFHQVHGGVSTNQRRAGAGWEDFHDEYVRITGKAFRKPACPAIFLGAFRTEHQRSLQLSARIPGKVRASVEWLRCLISKCRERG